jgi:PAS domain S-box-containing protein
MDDEDLLSLSTLGEADTETIELNNLLTQDLTPSGSFKLGRIPATTFGQLLEALPIPAFLVDLSHCVAFANEACRKISLECIEIEGTRFSSLISSPFASNKITALLEAVFSTRKSRVTEAPLKIGARKIWARMSFRSLRLGNDRLILVLAEDLTGERKQLLLRQRHNAQLSREVAQRRQAEEQIQRKNEFLRSVLEAFTHPFYIINANDYTIHTANSAAVSSGYCSGSTCYSITHRREDPCGGTDHLCPMEEIKRTGRPVVAEHAHYDTNGELQHVEVHAYPIFDQDGSVVQIIEYCLDITDRKRMEVALSDSEKQYRDLFENASDMMYTHDMEGNYTSVNNAATRISGYDSAELLKLNFRDLVDPKYLSVTVEQFRKKKEDGLETTGPYEVLLRAKNGATRWVEVNSRVIKKDGKPVGVQGTARDITERRKMEAALRASETRYREVVEKANDIIYLTDEKGIVGLVNAAATRIIGYSEYDLIGKHYLDLVARTTKNKCGNSMYYSL